MQRKARKEFYYMFPGSRRAAMQRMRRNRVVSLTVGLVCALVLGFIFRRTQGL